MSTDDSEYFSLDESSKEDEPYYDDSYDEPPPLTIINFQKLKFYDEHTDSNIGYWIKDLPYILCSYDKSIYRIYFAFHQNYYNFNVDIHQIDCFIDDCEIKVKNLLLNYDKYKFITEYDPTKDKHIVKSMRMNGKKCNIDDYKFFIDPYKLVVVDPITTHHKTISTIIVYDFYKQFENKENMYENMLFSKIVAGYSSSSQGLLFRNEFKFDDNFIEIVGVATFTNENVDKLFKEFLLQLFIRNLYFRFYVSYDSENRDKLFKNILLQPATIYKQIEDIVSKSFVDCSQYIYNLFSDESLSNPFSVNFLLNINGRYFFVMNGEDNKIIIDNEKDLKTELYIQMHVDTTYSKENIGERYISDEDKFNFKIISNKSWNYFRDTSIYIFSSIIPKEKQNISNIIKKYHTDHREIKNIKNDFIINKLVEENKNLTMVRLELQTKKL